MYFDVGIMCIIVDTTRLPGHIYANVIYFLTRESTGLLTGTVIKY